MPQFPESPQMIDWWDMTKTTKLGLGIAVAALILTGTHYTRLDLTPRAYI